MNTQFTILSKEGYINKVLLAMNTQHPFIACNCL